MATLQLSKYEQTLVQSLLPFLYGCCVTEQLNNTCWTREQPARWRHQTKFELIALAGLNNWEILAGILIMIAVMARMIVGAPDRCDIIVVHYLPSTLCCRLYSSIDPATPPTR